MEMDVTDVSAERTAAEAGADTGAFNRRKVYVTGATLGVRVPFVEVALAPTPGPGPVPNAPVLLYDTSGPGSIHGGSVPAAAARGSRARGRRRARGAGPPADATTAAPRCAVPSGHRGVPAGARPSAPGGAAGRRR